jgi:hypothetical protein
MNEALGSQGFGHVLTGSDSPCQFDDVTPEGFEQQWLKQQANGAARP